MQQTASREVKGVFFDLYGTLLILGDMKRAWSDWSEVLHACLCPPEMAVTRESFGDCCHQFFGKEEPAAETGDGLTVFERRIRRLAASLGSQIELPLLKETANRAVNEWQIHVQLDPDAPAVLSGLAQSKTLALISNFDHPPHAHRVLRETGLASYFKTTVISGEVGIKKPDPEIFKIVLEHTGLNSDEVVYVGDTQEDVDGATAAGIKPILIARPEDPQRPKLLDYTRNHEITAEPAFSNSALTIGSLRELIGLV
jgi:HAD superfamily hydrolase (TIGR01549 family)